MKARSECRSAQAWLKALVGLHFVDLPGRWRLGRSTLLTNIQSGDEVQSGPKTRDKATSKHLLELSSGGKGEGVGACRQENGHHSKFGVLAVSRALEHIGRAK